MTQYSGHGPTKDQIIEGLCDWRDDLERELATLRAALERIAHLADYDLAGDYTTAIAQLARDALAGKPLPPAGDFLPVPDHTPETDGTGAHESATTPAAEEE